MRKKNSLFDQVCNFINSVGIGNTFTNDELYSNTNEVMTDYKIRLYKGDRQTTRYYRYHLIHANVVKRVSKGVWQVLAHIPDGVTLSMVEQEKFKNGKRREFVWKAGVELPNNKEIKMNNNNQNLEEITLYEITKNNLVLPIVVGVNRVPALLSTGTYFEDETDAAYFLSVGTGIPVEVIKKNSHDFIENGAKEEPELFDSEKALLEKLHDLIPIDGPSSIPDNIPFKWVYSISGISNEVIWKCRAHIDEVITWEKASDSLLKLLQRVGGSTRLWTELAEEFIEDLEFEQTIRTENPPNEALKLAADNYKLGTHNEYLEKETEKLITLEDIRGKEVYFFHDSKMTKGVIKRFGINVPTEGNPFYIDISVYCSWKETIDFNRIDELSFTKEDFIMKLTKMVDNL